MSTLTIEWMDVGTIQDTPQRGARRVRCLGATIALFRTHADEVFALEDRCPHSSGPLSQGIVHDDCVRNPPASQLGYFGVGRTQIEQAITEQNRGDVQAVGECLQAGTHCGACRSEIHSLIKECNQTLKRKCTTSPSRKM